jgi:membrane-associated phospholipid phosphatase
MTRRRRDVAGLVVGVAALAGTAALARRRGSGIEVALFRAVNGLPDGASPAVWVPMQYGSLGTVPALAAVALARGRPRLATAIGVGGTSAWILAKAVKRIVDRGRPTSVVAGVLERGREEGDQGFPSGHAAVSAALTVVAWPDATLGWRLAAASLAGFVPLARLYVGAHLPLDVVGGSALGLAIGCAVRLVTSAPSP